MQNLIGFSDCFKKYDRVVGSVTPPGPLSTNDKNQNKDVKKDNEIYRKAKERVEGTLKYHACCFDNKKCIVY